MQVKMGEILNISGFDPLNVDVADIMELTKQIPKNGIVDVGIADQLAAIFLHGFDRCSELLSQASRWYGIKVVEKNKAKAEASLIRAEQAGYGKTQGSKDSYASMDPEYIKASQEEANAFAWKRWLEDKMELFIKWHHLCKSIAERHNQGNFTADVTPPNTNAAQTQWQQPPLNNQES